MSYEQMEFDFAKKEAKPVQMEFDFTERPKAVVDEMEIRPTYGEEVENG